MSVRIRGRLKIRDYCRDTLEAPVLSHPRLWPLCLNEDVVSNKSTLSGQRQRELKETGWRGEDKQRNSEK